MVISYSQDPRGPVGTITAHGYCERKRGSLWSYQDTFPLTGGGGFTLADAMTHLTLVCDQDRPTTDVQLDRALMGEAYDHPELPFEL